MTTLPIVMFFIGLLVGVGMFGMGLHFVHHLNKWTNPTATEREAFERIARAPVEREQDQRGDDHRARSQDRARQSLVDREVDHLAQRALDARTILARMDVVNQKRIVPILQEVLDELAPPPDPAP